MAEGHGHGVSRAPHASERTARILGGFVAVAFLLVVIGAMAVWPRDQSYRSSFPGLPEGSSIHYGIVTSVDAGADTADVIVTGEEVRGAQPMELLSESVREVPGVGDNVEVLRTAEGELWFSDFDRRSPMVGLLLAYVVVVIGVAWWRGLGALLGLAVSFGIILFFTVPALFDGQNALVVGLVSGAGAMFVLLYLAHGVNARTTTALLGTLAGLGVTGLLGWWAVSASSLTGFWSDEGVHLMFLQEGVSLTGVVLCGVILAGLGILNDVTVTQASAVWELRAANPKATRRELYTRGMRIGRDHIASTVYTIAFAYVGAGLPLIMMTVMFDSSVVSNLTATDVAEEIVRTLVGSIGLVLAVPLTTVIGAVVVGANAIKRPPSADGTPPQVDEAENPPPPGSRPRRLGPPPDAPSGQTGRR